MVNLQKKPIPIENNYHPQSDVPSLFKRKFTYIIFIAGGLLFWLLSYKINEHKLIQQETLLKLNNIHNTIINHGYYSVGQNPIQYTKDNVLYKLISIHTDEVIVLQSQASKEIITIKK